MHKKNERIVEILKELSDIHSPTGYTRNAMKHIEDLLTKANIKCHYSNKGALIASNHPAPTIVAAAHVDTLGLMVKQIKSDGTLAFTKLGGPMLQAFEGNTVRIICENQQIYSGSLILNNPAVHVNKTASEDPRNEDTMHVRIDAEVHNKKETEELGIQVGDFIAFDSGFEYTDSGFVKSHF